MRILACIFVLAVVATVPAKPVRQPPPETKSDQDLVQGDWTVVSAKKEKDNIPQEKLDRTVFTFKGNEIHIVELIPGGEKPHIERASFKFDSTKKPKELEIQPIQIGNGPPPPPGNQQPVVLGIYDLDGNTLRICFGRPGNPRPAEFSTKDGVLTLRRKTP